jgi:hypothetical protein
MATVNERLATVETQIENLENRFDEYVASMDKRMNGNGAWLRFVIAMAIQTGIFLAAVAGAVVALKHG